MQTPYDAGRANAGHTDAPPSVQTLKNQGLSDTKVGEFLKGWGDGKK